MAAQSGQAGACWRTAGGQGAGDPRPSFGSAGPTPAAASSPVSPSGCTRRLCTYSLFLYSTVS